MSRRHDPRRSRLLPPRCARLRRIRSPSRAYVEDLEAARAELARGPLEPFQGGRAFFAMHAAEWYRALCQPLQLYILDASEDVEALLDAAPAGRGPHGAAGAAAISVPCGSAQRRRRSALGTCPFGHGLPTQS